MNRHFLSAALAALAVFTSIAPPAIAHTSVTKTSIVNNSHLATPPKTFQVTLDHEASLASVRLTDSAGHERALEYRPSTDRRSSFALPLPALEDGSYKIEWKTVAKDGHVMNGAVSFMVMTH